MAENTTKTIFAVSDVHGHYTALARALEESGFDAGNENHVFLSAGDLFDRGPENAGVYAFVQSLPRKILLRGNHEEMLMEVLTAGEITERETSNGTDITLREILGEDAIDENGRIDQEKYAETIRELWEFLSSMGDYFEAGDCVITHGWLPADIDGRRARVRTDWKDASAEEWGDARWLEWQQLYAVGALLAGRIIVCGHRPARMGSSFDPMREPNRNEPFYGNGLIAIDADTVNSGMVNVLRIGMSIRDTHAGRDDGCLQEDFMETK